MLKIETECLTISLQEQMIDIREDENFLAEFQEQSLRNWWVAIKNEYHELTSKANDTLLPVRSMYFCEVSFLALTDIKSSIKISWN